MGISDSKNWQELGLELSLGVRVGFRVTKIRGFTFGGVGVGIRVQKSWVWGWNKSIN